MLYCVSYFLVAHALKVSTGTHSYEPKGESEIKDGNEVNPHDESAPKVLAPLISSHNARDFIVNYSDALAASKEALSSVYSKKCEDGSVMFSTESFQNPFSIWTATLTWMKKTNDEASKSVDLIDTLLNQFSDKFLKLPVDHNIFNLKDFEKLLLENYNKLNEFIVSLGVKDIKDIPNGDEMRKTLIQPIQDVIDNLKQNEEEALGFLQDIQTVEAKFVAEQVTDNIDSTIQKKVEEAISAQLTSFKNLVNELTTQFQKRAQITNAARAVATSAKAFFEKSFDGAVASIISERESLLNRIEESAKKVIEIASSPAQLNENSGVLTTATLKQEFTEKFTTQAKIVAKDFSEVQVFSVSFDSEGDLTTKENYGFTVTKRDGVKEADAPDFHGSLQPAQRFVLRGGDNLQHIHKVGNLLLNKFDDLKVRQDFPLSVPELEKSEYLVDAIKVLQSHFKWFDDIKKSEFECAPLEGSNESLEHTNDCIQILDQIQNRHESAKKPFFIKSSLDKKDDVYSRLVIAKNSYINEKHIASLQDCVKFANTPQGEVSSTLKSVFDQFKEFETSEKDFVVKHFESFSNAINKNEFDSRESKLSSSQGPHGSNPHVVKNPVEDNGVQEIKEIKDIKDDEDVKQKEFKPILHRSNTVFLQGEAEDLQAIKDHCEKASELTDPLVSGSAPELEFGSRADAIRLEVTKALKLLIQPIEECEYTTPLIEDLIALDRDVANPTAVSSKVIDDSTEKKNAFNASVTSQLETISIRSKALTERSETADNHLRSNQNGYFTLVESKVGSNYVDLKAVRFGNPVVVAVEVCDSKKTDAENNQASAITDSKNICEAERNCIESINKKVGEFDEKLKEAKSFAETNEDLIKRLEENIIEVVKTTVDELNTSTLTQKDKDLELASLKSAAKRLCAYKAITENPTLLLDFTKTKETVDDAGFNTFLDKTSNEVCTNEVTKQLADELQKAVEGVNNTVGKLTAPSFIKDGNDGVCSEITNLSVFSKFTPIGPSLMSDVKDINNMIVNFQGELDKFSKEINEVLTSVKDQTLSKDQLSESYKGLTDKFAKTGQDTKDSHSSSLNKLSSTMDTAFATRPKYYHELDNAFDALKRFSPTETEAEKIKAEEEENAKTTLSQEINSNSYDTELAHLKEHVSMTVKSILNSTNRTIQNITKMRETQQKQVQKLQTDAKTFKDVAQATAATSYDRVQGHTTVLKTSVDKFCTESNQVAGDKSTDFIQTNIFDTYTDKRF